MADIDFFDEDGVGPEEADEDSSSDSTPEYFVGEMTQDDVVNRLNQVSEFPNRLRDLEGSAFGKMSALEQAINSLQRTLPSQAKFDPNKLSRIAKYDPELAKAIAEDLQEALSIYSLNDDVLAPYLGKAQRELQDRFNSDLVAAHHGDINEFAPEDWSNPRTQREKDYVQWYNTVSTWDQQKQLENRGVGAVKALNAFKEWEQKKNQERVEAAKGKERRLQSGMQPRGEKTNGKGRKLMTEEEGFLSAFEN